MSTALYTRLLELLPQAPILKASVYALHGDGTATVTYPGDARERVRNPLDAQPGDDVYVQSGAITGAAPALDYVLIEI